MEAPSNQVEDTNTITNWNFLSDFPELPDDLIQRPHLIDTIKNILSSATPVVFLEGEEGDGATTTLAQFCLANQETTFSLFIKPASRFAYSPDYLRRILAEQFSWYLFKSSLTKEHLDGSDFDSLVQKVRSKARSTPLYFLVDGLHQIPQEDNRILLQIIQEVLPLGVNNFRFIITGQQDSFSSATRKIKSKPYQQLRFRPEETAIYLKSHNISDIDALDIHNLCKGVPGRLASVRRLLNLGNTIDSIRDAEPSKYPEFVKLEFDSIGRLPDPQRAFLAAITFAKRHLSLEEAVEVSQITKEDGSSALQACLFLIRNASTGRIEFVSESHRRFAERQLEPLKKEALKRQVEFLIRHPKSEAALRFLPTYYEALNKQDEIIQLISPSHYSDLFSQTQSIASLRNRADLGARSALSLKRTTDVFKFALQKSIFVAVGTVQVGESEIEAAVALGKPNTALALANQASSKEDRLALLARYARRVKEKAGLVEFELTAYIAEIAKDLEFGSLGNKAVEIAADIILFDPDLAISIVERAEMDTPNDRTRDAAYMQLSLSASLSKIQHKTQTEDKAKLKISSESLRKLVNSFEALSTHLDSSEAIKTVESLEPNNRLFFLKSLIRSRNEDATVLDLVDYGLELVVRETSYTPKSSDLSDIATPLVNGHSDHERLKTIVSRFDAQKGLLAKTAFSKDMVRLELRLAGAELHFDQESCKNRIRECYYEIASIRTTEIQLECSAIFLGLLKTIDKENELEKADGFRELIRADLSKLLENVLANTADHIAALSGVLDILIDDDPLAALELARRLNTESRRTEVFGKIAKSIASKSYSSVNADILNESLRGILDKVIRANAVDQVVKQIGDGKDAKSWFSAIFFADDMLLKPAFICGYEICKIRAQGANAPVAAMADFKTRFETVTQGFNSSLDLIDAHFRAAEALAEADVESATLYYQRGIELKSNINPGSVGELQVLITSISLISRSFSPLMRKGELPDDMLSRLFYLIDTLPCLITKVQMYSELAERAWSAKRIDLCKKIVHEKCRPVIETIALSSSYCQNIALHSAFPALSVVHLETALLSLRDLDGPGADSALFNACMLRLRKLPTSDPYYDDSFDFSKVEREDILDAIALLEKIREDAMIYGVITHLITAICDKSNKLKFTAQQKTDFFQRCKIIIEKNLPDPNNITHEGFRIAALAQIYKLQEVSFSDWEALGVSAGKILNFADQGYILLAIAGAMPSKFDSHRQRHLSNALALFEQIPSSLDRLGRFRNYVRETWRSSVVSAKDTLRRAMLISIELSADDRVDESRRELIELADQISPELADELIELVDDDPARRHIKAEMKKTAATSKAKRDMANGKDASDIAKNTSEEISDAAWKNTAGLLAGRIETKPLAIMTEYVMRASKDSIQDAYGVLSWYLENSAKKYISDSDISMQIEPISEALLLSTEIAVSVISRAKQRAAKSAEERESSGSSMLLKPGSRAEALSFIARWLNMYAAEVVKISDPYFGPGDIDLLRIILSECPNSRVCILASKAELQRKNALSDEPFLEQWRAQMDQDPPDTEIIAMAYEAGNKSVIHDRWMLTNGAGLRLGTSFNSLGQGKISEISEMDSSSVSACNDVLDRFIARPRVVDGARVSYVVFNL